VLALSFDTPLMSVLSYRSNPYDLPAFGFSHSFFSSYAFTSFATTLEVKDGDTQATNIACISTNITPDLGSTLTGVLTFIPLLVLVFVGFATAFAAVFSPWGTADVFRWTTNYGRDADLLRLVTPGFGDCLQYIQFIALTGGLTLDYPGFYQPVVSKVAWSVLMFNQSFVSHGNETNSLVDGIYVTNGVYGLDNLRQLVGENGVEDVWAGMTIWLLVIIGAVLLLIQLGFLSRSIYRHINHTPEEDLRAKNMPFSVGNVIRIVFNYFLLPAVALSTFQFVVAGQSPIYTVILAAIMLVLIIGFAVWLLYLIATIKPRSYLFDDLPTVLLYGSLYNTYSDNAAPFALVPVLVTFIRGLAIGAVQPSGVAQLVLLAICEVIIVLALHAFRPFHSPTSMNAYHTFYAVLRFATILLMISFAPSLNVSEGPKGWIGYGILLMHAIVLIFGFLLNAVQTIVEVAARMAGAGGDESGATRGGLVKVFGVRQLSKRLPRRDATASRQSQLSSAAMMDSENDKKAYMMESGRLRSQSAGSGGLQSSRQGTGLDAIDPYGAILPQQLGSGGSSTHGGTSTFSFLPSAAVAGAGQNTGSILGISQAEASDPYYRPPRIRRPVLGAYSPGARSRESSTSGDLANGRWVELNPASPNTIDPSDPSISGRGTPAQQPADGEVGRSKADYTTREVDFYYGVRGPALNANVPSRRIKTGPTDPTGIPASAAGWFKGLFGGKTKDKGKGFEVVRSARMPPGMVARGDLGTESPPEGIPVAKGGIRNGPIDSDDESVHAGPSTRRRSGRSAVSEREAGNLVSPLGSEDEDSGNENVRISDVPPLLPGIEIGKSGIELPSRFASNATSKHGRQADQAGMTDIPLNPTGSRPPSRKPTVPRKSSRRKSQNMDFVKPEPDFHELHKRQVSQDVSELPFGRAASSRGHSTNSTRSSIAQAGALRPRNTSALGPFSADVHGDRPTSVGYVNQRSIQTVNPSENPEFLGSSAEVVSGRISDASSTEHQP
jgi:hypothetical protein